MAHGDSPIDEAPLEDAIEFEAVSTKDHDLDVATNALADRELDALLAEDQRQRHSEESITRTLAGDELNALLAASRRRSMATIPDVTGEMLAKTAGKRSDPDLATPGEALEEADVVEEGAAVPHVPLNVGQGSAAAALNVGQGSAAPPPSPSPGAWAVGPAEIAGTGGRPGLTSLPEWANASQQRRRRRWAAMIGGSIVLVAIGVYFAISDTDSAPEPAASTPSATEAPPPPPSPPKAAAPVPSQAEIEAREALGKLREGMGDCIRHGIGTLPGSSPAIPSSLKLAKAPGYTPGPMDWKTAVWSCARFRLAGPMRFQVQWQLIKPSVEGLGVVWIDEDGDGTADRALGFRATLRARRDPVLGEIGPIEASQTVVAVP